MVVNVSVQHNAGFLPEMILLTLCDSIGERNPFNTIYSRVFVLTANVLIPPINLLIAQEEV